jgi:hypothetical protein
MPGRSKAPKKKSKPKSRTKKPSARVKVKPRAKAPPRVAKKRHVKKSATKLVKKKAAKKKTTPNRPIPAPRPSERALAASSQRPSERSLSDEEREAMAKVASTAKRFLEAVGGPDAVVHRIAAFVDEIRTGVRPEPKSQDVRLGLGALWGEQVRAQLGWIWVHLTYPDGFASYAVVPDDRAFACFPLNRMQELMKPGARANTTVAVFNSLVAGTIPQRRPNAYLVIG